MTARDAMLPDPHRPTEPLHDEGLAYDVRTMVSRRHALGLFAGVSAATLLAACGVGSPSASPSTTAAGTAADLAQIPEETAGPYPGDGSNGVNVLDDSGIVRSDIRSSFGSSSTVAGGVPLTVRLSLRSAATGDALAGAAVYLWHCDREGRYSMYSDGVTEENYLRGVQAADDTGTVTFTTVYPGCYAGRWPHIHFEVYAGVDDAVSSGPIVRTSQVALTRESAEAVYATSGYEASVGNLAQTSLARDNVFGDDGGIHQLATISGDVASGYSAVLAVAV